MKQSENLSKSGTGGGAGQTRQTQWPLGHFLAPMGYLSVMKCVARTDPVSRCSPSASASKKERTAKPRRTVTGVSLSPRSHRRYSCAPEPALRHACPHRRYSRATRAGLRHANRPRVRA